MPPDDTAVLTTAANRKREGGRGLTNFEGIDLWSARGQLIMLELIQAIDNLIFFLWMRRGGKIQKWDSLDIALIRNL